MDAVFTKVQLKSVLKGIGISLLIALGSVFFLLAYFIAIAALDLDEDKTALLIGRGVIILSTLSFFAASPAYLVRRFARGILKKILYGLLAVLSLGILFMFGIAFGPNETFEPLFETALFCFVMGIPFSGIIFLIHTFTTGKRRKILYSVLSIFSAYCLVNFIAHDMLERLSDKFAPPFAFFNHVIIILGPVAVLVGVGFWGHAHIKKSNDRKMLYCVLIALSALNLILFLEQSGVPVPSMMLCLLLSFVVIAFGAHTYIKKSKNRKMLYCILIDYLALFLILFLKQLGVSSMQLEHAQNIWMIVNVPLTWLFIFLKIYDIIEAEIERRANLGLSIDRLDGRHICGLSENEGVLITVKLYKEKLTISSYGGDIEPIEIPMGDIVSVSSRMRQENLGSRTTVTESGGHPLTSTVAAMNGDWGAALFFSRGRHKRYKTKQIIENHWYFMLETDDNIIMLETITSFFLRIFVGRCNKWIRRYRFDSLKQIEEKMEKMEKEKEGVKN